MTTGAGRFGAGGIVEPIPDAVVKDVLWVGPDVSGRIAELIRSTGVEHCDRAATAKLQMHGPLPIHRSEGLAWTHQRRPFIDNPRLELALLEANEVAPTGKDIAYLVAID